MEETHSEPEPLTPTPAAELGVRGMVLRHSGAKQARQKRTYTGDLTDTGASMDLIEANLETQRHINRVQSLLMNVIGNLGKRAVLHDESKLKEPEASVFAEYTAKLKGLTYGSDEYKACLAGMKPPLDHHYAHNSHHPEHWPNGIRDMSLLDLIEMFVDWKAASERHADGDIERSITINKQRFGYSDDLEAIFRRTARELFPPGLKEA